MRTQVGILGAGPAGLVLAQLLHGYGIDSVVLETRSREYVESRIRAGVLEQGTAELLTAMGVGERMHRQGLVHHGIELRHDGAGHRIAFDELVGRSITVYGQQEVVKDLIAARTAAGLPLEFDVSDTVLSELDSARPMVSYRKNGTEQLLECDVVAGCDGFHGTSRPAVPAGRLRAYERHFPYAWLGILAEVAPSTEELIYARHDDGFALHSMRSPTLSRFYLQCAPDEDLANWPDERIWEQLARRLGAAGWSLATGPIIDKGVTAMRSYVVEPMRYGRLFLAGDAAHIVPPTGAKGMNLAIADVAVLADALAAWYRSGADGPLDDYSERCLRRVWRGQDFSSWMTMLLHRHADEFENRRQRSRLRYLTGSLAGTAAAARSLAENYVGLEQAW